MRIVMIGDIVGKPGRQVVQQQMPAIRRMYEPDLVIANAENIAGGSGITATAFHKLVSYGIDGMTLGDHAFRQRDSAPLLNGQNIICRPANLPQRAAGRRWIELTTRSGKKLVVITVLGRIFMTGAPADDPFATVEELLRMVPAEAQVLVEVHAEATSEKVAMGHFLDGRVIGVVGTHTHIPTADAKVLPRGTAYMTDLGMTGPYDSVLGRKKECVLQFMTTAMPVAFDVASEDVRLCGVFIETDDATRRAVRCERIELLADPDGPPFNHEQDRHD
jgi:metallophosphoesterase (TIGR00282 family)